MMYGKKNILDKITEMKISYKFQENENLNQENMQLINKYILEKK